MSSRDPLQELPELQELKGALSFPTSPDFCARVRRHVAAEPPRSRAFRAHSLAVAAAVMLTTAIGGYFTYRSPDVNMPQVSRPVIVDAVKAIALIRVPSRPVVRRAKEPAVPFATIVPDDQLRALDHLLAAMREGRATVPPTVLNEELNDNGQRVPRALTIEPMKLELLAGTPGEPDKDPVKDPIR